MRTALLVTLCVISVWLCGATPPNFPEITFSINTDPTPGSIYLSNLTTNQNITNTPFLMILNNMGDPIYAQEMTARMNLDFKLQPNGMRTYYDNFKGKFYALNHLFEIVDSFSCDGYLTDGHELLILPNGHSFMLGSTQRVIDLSGIVEGGNPEASIQDMLIQEQDENHNVVFQWNTSEHFEVTDCASNSMLLLPIVDYVHCNSIDIDAEGNLLLSSRHMDEITKIDHTTGEIIWRMGGSRSKNNMFAFANDTVGSFTGFSHQHCVRWLPNGHLLMFDNGNLKTPPNSRVVEYEVDQVNYVVTKIWEYVPAPVIISSGMGSAQRLQNGNTFIGWGTNNQGFAGTEVTPVGQVVQEFSFPQGVYSYRVFKVADAVSVEDAIATPPIGLQAFPNPFTASTQICIKSELCEPVEVQIYNCRGQHVQTIHEERPATGDYLITWNGRDKMGKDVASGIYFVRIKQGNRTEAIKILKLK